MSMLVAAIALTSLSVSYSLPTPLRQGQRLYNGKKLESQTTLTTSPEDRSKFFTQTLDHFNRQDGRTFQQRYFVNDTFWTGADSNAPVFMCVGGEGPPLDASVLISSVHCNDMVELAPKHGALMVALEHRYYGPSNPFDDLATEHLQWLNSEQALGDIASFHQLISNDYGTSNMNKWVTWGGSYPGMMAAMARLRYPNLIHAAVSSSSPMQAAVDMVGYNDVVASSMAAEVVGGSTACLNTVIDGHKTIGEKLQTAAGQKELEKLFDVCEPGSLSDIKNQEQFAGDGVVYLPAQGNDPECTTPYCNIAGICELFASEDSGASAIDKLAYLSKIQHAGACVNASYETMIKGMANPKNPERTWLYQTCTEWGFYQTCEEGSQCPYTQGLHTLSSDYDICTQAFGIPADAVNRQISYTNAMYGGNQVQGTRIMYPNGQIDPWHALGVLDAPNAQEPVLWVEGASHHYWTHPSLPTDSDFIKNARVAIWNQVDAWLTEPAM